MNTFEEKQTQVSELFYFKLKKKYIENGLRVINRMLFN